MAISRRQKPATTGHRLEPRLAADRARPAPATRDLATEIRNLDATAGPAAFGWRRFQPRRNTAGWRTCCSSSGPTLGTAQELADLRPWLLGRSRLARPGTPALAAHRNASAPSGSASSWCSSAAALPGKKTSIRSSFVCETFHAIAAGRGALSFHREQPLAIDTGPAALRTDAIRLINMELRLLEPWIAAGQLTEEMAAGDGSLQVSVAARPTARGCWS